MKHATQQMGSVMPALALLVILPLGSREAKAGPVILNPSFEIDTYTSFTPIVTNWVRIPGTGGTHPSGFKNGSPYGNTPYGTNFVVLGGGEDNGTSALEQTISGFTVGAAYKLSFAISSEFTSSDKVNVSFVGSSVAAQDFTAVPFPGNSQFWFTWETKSETFVADATSMTLHLHSYASNYEVGIDNFQLTQLSSVPEPSTIASAGIAGLMGLGLAWRRRAKITA